MDIRIDKDSCSGCGLCVDTAPDVFELDEESNVAKLKIADVPESLLDAIREASANCPVEAIIIRE